MDNYTVTEIVQNFTLNDIAQEYVYQQEILITPQFTDTVVVQGGNVLYTHTQTTPLTTWTINHNLGIKPQVQLLSLGGIEFDGNVIHTSSSQTIIYFTTAISGIAQLRI